jgi:hypothetical protein
MFRSTALAQSTSTIRFQSQSPLEDTMRKPTIPALLAGLSLSLSVSLSVSAAGADQWTLPVQVKQLDNGLTVIVSEDHSSRSRSTPPPKRC